MENRELAAVILEGLGGIENIADAENCMTRLRITVFDPSKVDDEALKKIEGVIMVIHQEPEYVQVVLGPGKVRDVMTEVNDACAARKYPPWQETKKAVEGKQNQKLVCNIRVIADIFTPMIPAFVASGISNGLARIIGICIANAILPETRFVLIIQALLELISNAYLGYLAIYTGVNSAKQFGLNPMMGGMIGGASLSPVVNKVSELIGWYNADVPNESILATGAGGIIGVVFGVWVLSKIEKWIHSHMPEVLDVTFTPLLSMLVMMPLYILAIMPVTGVISTKTAAFLSLFMYTDNVIVSVMTGYVLAAVFLPLVLLGLHRGLTPVYAIQIENLGGTTLFPAVAMAGAGQVGAAIALYFKAKRKKNKRMQSVITAAIPAGILGIGEPLIYGVTLPLMRPFFTAGLGAGFGGAWCMARHVMSTAYSPSGILGVTVMIPEKMLDYVIGILLSYVMGAVLTWFFIPDTYLE